MCFTFTPQVTIVMILDNTRIHHAKLLKSFLKKHEDMLQMEFLPEYIPKLNLLEGLWKRMKSAVINNVFFPSLILAIFYSLICFLML